MQFKAEIPITAKQIADLLVGAFEGGSNYWCMEYQIVKTPAEVVPNGVVVYSHPEFWAGDFEIKFRDEDDDWHTVTPADIQPALNGMATGKYAHHFANWMRENDDAETSDVFLQFLVYKDVIYG